MPYTSHGHWYGPGDPTEPRPDATARCGGPAICRECSEEAGKQPAITLNATGPAIFYVTADRTVHAVDADGWDPTGTSLRDRRLCRALLTHALDKLDLLDKAEHMGLVVGRQETGRG